MINMIVLYQGLLSQEFYAKFHKMTWSDVAIFDKVKSSTSFSNASSLVIAEAMILKIMIIYIQNNYLNAWEVSSNFQ